MPTRQDGVEDREREGLFRMIDRLKAIVFK